MDEEREVSDLGVLRGDFNLYAERARREHDPRLATVWSQMAERTQKIMVAAMAVDDQERPGDIAELMNLMDGDPATIIRRLLATFTLAEVEDAMSEVVASVMAGLAEDNQD